MSRHQVNHHKSPQPPSPLHSKRGGSAPALWKLLCRPCFYPISNYKNIIPQYLDNAIIDLAQNSRPSRRLLEENLSSRERFLKNSSSAENTAASKIGIASFSRYDNSDATIAILEF